MREETECPECKGKQLIIYSCSMGLQYCTTCEGFGTVKVERTTGKSDM
jgi:hypothetical protein